MGDNRAASCLPAKPDEGYAESLVGLQESAITNSKSWSTVRSTGQRETACCPSLSAKGAEGAAAQKRSARAEPGNKHFGSIS